MKRKLILSLALAVTLNTTTFALELNKAHLISHKESATAGVKASYVENKTTFKAQLPIKHSDYGVAISTSSAIPLNTGILGRLTEIKASHFAYVANYTQEVKTYVLNMRTCLVNSVAKRVEQCAESIDEVQIQAGGSVKSEIGPILVTRLDQPGNYETASTVFVYDKDNEINQSASAAISVLQIVKN